MANNDINFRFSMDSHVGELNTQLSGAVKKALEEIGIEAEAHAKEIITEKGAVDTGNLRNSITHQVGEKDGQAAVYVGSNVNYAPYVELGTSRMKARAFLDPAVEDFKDEYKRIVEDNLGK